MTGWWTTAVIGIGAGLAASFAMAKYQEAAAPLFGMDEGGESSTQKAADSASEAVTGQPIAPPRRQSAGNAVHYLTGTALGLGYTLAARRWPRISTGFGTAFGFRVAALLDNFLVPLFGWGKWPTKAGLASQGYSLSSHAVYGSVLEGSRRLALAAAG